MTEPCLTAVTPRWEADIAARLGSSPQVHVVRRCADLAELLGCVAAGVGRLVLLSVDLRGVDAGVVEELHRQRIRVVGVHAPGDADGRSALVRWGVTAVLAGDAEEPDVELALAAALAVPVTRGSGPGEGERADPGDGADLDGGPGATTHRADGRPEPTGSHPGAQGRPAPDTHPGPGPVVVVWGPVGAPGRTTVAVGIAAELADPVRPVVLVDADTYGASVAQVLAVLDEAPGLAAAARAVDQGRWDRETLARLAPEVAPGLRVLTGLPRADRWPEVREAALLATLEECAGLAAVTVVDVAACLEQDEDLTYDTAAPRRNGAALCALERADHVVVVGSADAVGLQRLVRGLDLLAQVCDAPRTVVVNRVRAAAVGADPDRRIRQALARFAGVDDAVLLPDDSAADAAVLAGRTLREHAPGSRLRGELRALAGRWAPLPREAGRRGRLRRLTR